jgi:hypothetical protein
MLFLWQTAAESLDSLTIYLPNSGRPEHQTLFSEFRGGKNNRLERAHDRFKVSTSSEPARFTLRLPGPFTRARSNFLFSPTTDDLLVDTRTLAAPRHGPFQVTQQHRYSIRVPYPTSVRAYRAIKYEHEPFRQSKEKDFNITAKSLYSVHVLTYDGCDGSATLRYDGDPTSDQVLGTDEAPSGLTLYLYSQTDSLQHVNEMVKYCREKTFQPLDLVAEEQDLPVRYDPPADADDLQSDDLKTLAELADGRIYGVENFRKSSAAYPQVWGI